MPAFLGLPLLARFIGWLFASVIGYFAKYLTIGVARIALAISLFIGLVIGLSELLVSYLSDLVSVLPPEMSDAISYIIPSNAAPCLYAIFSLKAALFIFDIKDRIIGYLDWNKT
jgi:hypothetical protein